MAGTGNGPTPTRPRSSQLPTNPNYCRSGPANRRISGGFTVKANLGRPPLPYFPRLKLSRMWFRARTRGRRRSRCGSWGCCGSVSRMDGNANGQTFADFVVYRKRRQAELGTLDDLEGDG